MANEDDYWSLFKHFQDIESGEPAKKRRKRRGSNANEKELWKSTWGEMLLDPSTNDPDSVRGKQWMSRFRIPFPIFTDVLVPECTAANIFELSGKRKEVIPIQFKIMVALRILSRNNDMDTMEELTGIKRSTIHTIFTKFIVNFTGAFFDKYVNLPEGEELTRIMNAYKMMGFNGAFGSVDCTHVYWNKCPKGWANYCSGKEKRPTLAFLAVVDHDKRVLWVSDAFFGAANDKLIVKAFEKTNDLMRGSMEHIYYNLYNRDGNLVCVKGAYLIADGGFLKVGCMMDPSHERYTVEQVRWSEYCESIRKDVECFFGILKIRWRFLMFLIEYHCATFIQNCFKCACILHNMILQFDRGRHEECARWENVDWENMNPDMDYDVENIPHVAPELVREEMPFLPAPTELEKSRAISISANNKTDYWVLKSMLQESFTAQSNLEQVYWPKRFQPWQKECLAITKINNRIANEVFNSLLGLKSSIMGLRPDAPITSTDPKDYTVDCGTGLYSTLTFHAKDVVAEFHGTIIDSVEEYDRRLHADKARYIIQLRQGYYLDCASHVGRGACKASYANSALNAWDTKLNKAAVNNCKLKISGDRDHKVAKLVCNVPILPRMTEILWPYGRHHAL